MKSQEFEFFSIYSVPDAHHGFRIERVVELFILIYSTEEDTELLCPSIIVVKSK